MRFLKCKNCRIRVVRLVKSRLVKPTKRLKTRQIVAITILRDDAKVSIRDVYVTAGLGDTYGKSQVASEALVCIVRIANTSIVKVTNAALCKSQLQLCASHE